MSEQLLRYGAGGETNLSLIAVVFVLVASLLILVLPRKYVIIPLFFTAFFLPLGQRIIVIGLHFTMFRIIILVGWLRVILGGLSSNGDGSRFRANAVDKALILYVFSGVVTFTLLWGDSAAFVDRLGFLYNAFGIYFLLRVLYRDEGDVDRTIRVFGVICAVLAVCMVTEQFTGRNLFSVFGGVPELTYVREGKLRSQGAFAHPILAGTFGATMLPLFIGLWWQGKKARAAAVVGTVSATLITITSMSSTPLMAYFAGILGLCFWPFRRHMRLFRWAVVISLVSLHMVMKAPVWALIARVNLVGGSSGDHRYELVNQFINHFGEWWLLGVKEAEKWGYEMSDLSNQFVEAGVTGGLLTLVLFVAIIVYCFKRLGEARAASRDNPQAERRLWALGAALFSNVAAFFGISYFDQTIVSWYTLVAMIVAATTVALRSSSSAASAPAYLERAVSAFSPAVTRNRSSAPQHCSRLGFERSLR
jgi:hypothetical protein